MYSKCALGYCFVDLFIEDCETISGFNVNVYLYIFQKFKCPGALPGGGGGKFKLRFDWCIRLGSLRPRPNVFGYF